jgi:DNA modification methylase
VCGNDECGRDFPQNYLFCPQCGASVDDAKDVRMNDIEAYIGWLRARLQECHRVLKQTGSIYVHLDWHAVHYVKVMMDDIFGMKNFGNEIIWHYITAPATKKNFGRKHDTILFYKKSSKSTFNVQRVPHSQNTSAVRVYKHGDKEYICNTNPDGKVMDDVWGIPIIAAMDVALLSRSLRSLAGVG